MACEHDGSWNRRQFLTGLIGGGAALAALGVVGAPAAGAQPAAPAPPIRDTINGVLSFVVPGNDPYSHHQGVATDRPGGVTPGTAASLERTLDRALAIPLFGGVGVPLPGAAGVAVLLNIFAATADPGASNGPFAAPFANLDFAKKALVFEWLDTDPRFENFIVRFVVNSLPTLAAFAAFSEVSAFDPVERKTTGRPVGWDLSNYAGPSDGWDEVIGYYRGIDKVEA